MGISAILDKKSEKSYIQEIKYFFKDLIKKDKQDFKTNIQRVVIFILVDKFNIFLIGSQEEKYSEILQKILLLLTDEKFKEIDLAFKKCIDLEEQTKQEVREASVVKDFENSVFEFIKIAKM